MISTVSIEAANASEAEEVCAGLRGFNACAVRGLDFVPLWLVVRDASGALQGGLVGEIYLGWLSIDALWVAEPIRGLGTGSALLRKAEKRAVELGAGAAYLDTFHWQAARFYERHGYAEFGRLEDFPAGSPRLFMQKKLMAIYPDDEVGVVRR